MAGKKKAKPKKKVATEVRCGCGWICDLAMFFEKHPHALTALTAEMELQALAHAISQRKDKYGRPLWPQFQQRLIDGVTDSDTFRKKGRG